MNKTKVQFRKFPYPDYMSSMKDEVEIIALFPEVRFTHSRDTIVSYVHVGQHGEASKELITELEPASPEEYKDLLQELQSIGYELEILE